MEVSLITYTKEDFLNSSAPYDHLFAIKNPFQRRQEIEKFQALCETYGISGKFSRIWKSYLEQMAPAKQDYVADNVTAFPEQDLQLRCGEYECDERGVRIYSQMYGVLTVCPHPIMPVRRIVNLDTAEHKIVLKFLRGKEWRAGIFDKSILASAQRIVSLATWGIAVDSENARALVTYLSQIENLNYDALAESKSVGRLGWVDGYGFSPYVEGLEFDGNDKYRHAFEAVHPQGSEDTWMDIALRARAGQSVAVRIMLAASFASALVGPLNALPFICHCWSNVAGIGKTVGLMLAASVWANPQTGEYMQTFNTTNVGIEMMAGFCGSLPLCLDELCLKDGRRDQFDSMIYNFCEGAGRTRGSRNGGLQRTVTWRNCAISTGEEPLTNGNSKAGAINRVLDINAGNIRMFDDPRETVRLLCRNYGHAGKRFVQMLMADKAAIETIKQWQDEYTQAMEGRATDKQILSASLVLAADRWVSEQIFNDGRALTVDEILPNLQTPESANVNRRCYNWIIDTVGSNPGHFTPREDGSYTGECWGCVDEDEDRIYIIKAIFDRLLRDEGYNGTGFLSWAGHEGLLYRTDAGHNTILKRISSGSVPVRCVCLRVKDIGSGEDEQSERTERSGRLDQVEQSGQSDQAEQIEPSAESQIEQKTTHMQEVMEGLTPVYDEDIPF